MVTWYYRSVFDDLDDMRQYREWLERQMYGPGTVALLPAGVKPEIPMLPHRPAMFRTDVSENEDELIVTATDMADGVTKKDITLALISPRALEIRCGRTEERASGNGRHYRDERTSWSAMKVIRLSVPVTDNGSSATFRNGVLEVRLKKIGKGPGRKISID